MVTRIFILDDSLVLKNASRNFGRIQNFIKSLKFEIVQGLNVIQLLNSLKIMKSIPQIFFPRHRFERLL